MVPRFAIPADAPVEVHIHRLVARVREAREEMTKLLLELNLHITELRLKAQLSNPLEVREQHASAIRVGMELAMQ